MLALIDGDVIVYRCGFASQEDSESIACVRAQTTIEDILSATGANEYEVWLSDSLKNNFRFQIDPEYKANRKDSDKPKHYNALRLFLHNEWQAEITDGQEADDILGIKQSQNYEEFYSKACPVSGTGDEETHEFTIICSNDKDLLQIQGRHFNFVRKELIFQDYFSGLRHFYSQFLIGDRVDNIEGVYGLGPKKTERLLAGCQTEYEMFEKVRYQYKDDARLLKNGRLLWIRREPNQLWDFPKNNEAIIQDESRECSDAVDGYSVGNETPSGGLLLG